MVLLKELWLFLSAHKKFWLLPIAILMVALGVLLVLGEGSPLAPLIYTIF